MTITRDRVLGSKHLIGGSSQTSNLTIEQVQEAIADDKALDLSVSINTASGATIGSNDDSSTSGQIIGFGKPVIDRGGFWDDAFPTIFPAIKTKIRIDNKPKYLRGIYKFGGELYVEKNPTGRRIFNIMAHSGQASQAGTSSFYNAVQLWRDIKIATDDDMPLYIHQNNFVFDGVAYQTQVAKAVGLPKPSDVSIYVYMTLRQDSGVPLKLYSASLWLKKVGELP